jgi:hypothetical protein
LQYLLLNVGRRWTLGKLPELPKTKGILNVFFYLGSLLIHLAYMIYLPQLNSFADE